MKSPGLLPKVVAVIVGMFLLVTLVSVLASRHLVMRDMDAQLTQQALTRLNAQQGTLQRFLMLQHQDGVRNLVSALGSEIDLRIAFVTDWQGLIIASTRFRDEGRHWSEAGHDLGPALDAAILERVTRARVSEVMIDTAGDRVNGYASVCDPTGSPNLRAEQCGFLFHQTDRGYHRTLASASLYRHALTSAAGFAGCCVLLLLIFHRGINRRVGRIQQALGRFAEGERSARIRLPGHDEIARISATVDRLLDELADDETALRESEQFKQAIIDSAHSALISTDITGLIRYFSAGAERMLGYRAGEVVGRERITRFHEPEVLRARLDRLRQRLGLDTDLPFIDVVRARLGQGGAYDSEWLYVAKSGERIPVSVSVTSLFDAAGEVAGYLSIARDISEEKRVAQSLKLGEQVFENAGEPIVVTDDRYRIVNVNPAYLRMSGFSSEELLGTIPGFVQSERHDRRFFRQVIRSIREGGAWTGEFWGRRKSGESFPQWLTISAITDDQGRITHYVGLFKDATHQKATEEALEYRAYHDPLTGLPNRELFKDRLQHELDVAERHGRQVALLFIDLDRFKQINDTLGHDVGDQLLRQVAERIRGTVRQSDTLARLGGDEFTLILADPRDVPEAGQLAGRLVAALEQGFRVDTRELFIGASIGIAVYPDDGSTLATLTRNADTAMYLAKQSGRGGYHFYTRAMNAWSERRAAVHRDLSGALARAELQARYQPRVQLTTGRVTALVARLYWQHPEFGPVDADEIWPVARELDHHESLGDWRLDRALADLAGWRADGHPVLLSLPMPVCQFRRVDLVDVVVTLLTRHAIDPAWVELTFAQGTLIAERERAAVLAHDLGKVGVQLSIDEFGIGNGATQPLRGHPLRGLVLSREFAREARTSGDTGIVRAIVAAAGTLRLRVVADGIDDLQQHQRLLDAGCDEAQGSLYGDPGSAEWIAELLATGAVTLLPTAQPYSAAPGP